MNFYISTFKLKTIKFKKWILLSLFGSFFTSIFIFTTNYIIDPYNITKYNLLNIKYKFARDDRTEKINYFSTLDKFDNILVGSSRVYSINPSTVTKLIGGTTYNFGLGTATIEDILGVFKYLEKNKKLPKNLIVGIDFYTFNKDVPPNKYFLQNKELNFLSYKSYNEDFVSKFFSFDAFKASLKTLQIHFLKKNDIPRFDSLGWACSYLDYSKVKVDYSYTFEKREIHDNESLFFSDYQYSTIDSKRVEYLEELKKLCKSNNVNLYIFNTPLHPYTLNIIEKNENLNKAKNEFLDYLYTFENFTNLYNDKDIYQELKNFGGATHTTANAGDLILQKVLKKHPNFSIISKNKGK